MREVEILGWKKFNPRSDVKRPSWFRMENGLFSDPQFFDFEAEELLAWVYLLAHASLKNGGVVYVNKRHVEMVGKIKWGSMESAIAKLEELQCVHSTARGRDVDVTDSPATNVTNGTNRTNERDGYGEVGPSTSDNFSLLPSGAKAPSGPKKKEPISRATWEAYEGAYLDRYKVGPVRNATVNGQMARFVKRLGEEVSPEVAVFYLTHNKSYYVTAQHPVGAMLKDAESLHTQWKTNRQITSADGRQAEKSAGFLSQMERIKRGEL